MFYKRIVASLTVKNGIVVQSIGFKKFLPIGKPEVSVEFLNRWGIDEIVLLEIDATAEKRKSNFDMVTRVSKKNFVALTVGGGIQDLNDMRTLIYCGADKICINKLSLTNPKIISQAANVFGSQCIVVSMDVKINDNGNYEVFSDRGKVSTGLNPIEWAIHLEALGAGEIFLNSIDRDGSKKGYDLKLVKSVTGVVSIPVITCGGVGHPQHFLEGFTHGKASASAAGNFFHFTEQSPVVAKAFLRQQRMDVRFDTSANYEDFDFHSSGRIGKRSEQYLEELLFEIIPEEII
jgi:cyclase